MKKLLLTIACLTVAGSAFTKGYCSTYSRNNGYQSFQPVGKDYFREEEDRFNDSMDRID